MNSLFDIQLENEYDRYDWSGVEALAPELHQSRLTTPSPSVLVPGDGTKTYSDISENNDSTVVAVAVVVLASLPELLVHSSNSNLVFISSPHVLCSVKENLKQQEQQPECTAQHESPPGSDTVVTAASAISPVAAVVGAPPTGRSELRRIRGRSKKIHPWNSSISTFVLSGVPPQQRRRNRNSSNSRLAPASSSATGTPVKKKKHEEK